MDVHVLNGDALREKFTPDGTVIVCREAFIEGPLTSTDEEHFWNARAHHLCGEGEAATPYFDDVKTEFDKLGQISPSSTVHLWFEHDLFCQVNMWFVLYFIRSRGMGNKIYRVVPPLHMENTWGGFGSLGQKEIFECLNDRRVFSERDLRLGERLWNSYRENNMSELQSLGNSTSECFPYLQEVCQAHIDRDHHRNGRPQKRLAEILSRGVTNFNDVFNEFNKTEGIYGFGDIQVKEMLKSIK